MRGTRYDDETKTTALGGKDWRSPIGMTAWTGGETLRWSGDFDAIQTDFNRRLAREVGHGYDRTLAKRRAPAASPRSLRPEAARDERAGARPGAQDRPSYGRARPGAVKGVGVHYSRAEREALDSTRYGSGIKGQAGGVQIWILHASRGAPGATPLGSAATWGRYRLPHPPAVEPCLSH